MNYLHSIGGRQILRAIIVGSLELGEIPALSLNAPFFLDADVRNAGTQVKT